MFRIIIAILFFLHGLVHLLYLGHSLHWFELKPGLTWPNGSWAISSILGEELNRKLADIALGIAAAGFLLGGAALFFKQAWWAMASIPRARPLTTLIPLRAIAMAKSSATWRPYGVTRRVPTIATDQSSSSVTSPRA